MKMEINVTKIMILSDSVVDMATPQPNYTLVGYGVLFKKKHWAYIHVFPVIVFTPECLRFII